MQTSQTLALFRELRGGEVLRLSAVGLASVWISSLLPGPCSQKRVLIPSRTSPTPFSQALCTGLQQLQGSWPHSQPALAHVCSWVSRGLSCFPRALPPLLCSQEAPCLRFSFHVGVPLLPRRGSPASGQSLSASSIAVRDVNEGSVKPSLARAATL